MFDKFELLHRNHKLAYLDGFLCGIATYHIVTKLAQNYSEFKAQQRAAFAEDNDNVVHIITDLP